MRLVYSVVLAAAVAGCAGPSWVHREPWSLIGKPVSEVTALYGSNGYRCYEQLYAMPRGTAGISNMSQLRCERRDGVKECETAAFELHERTGIVQRAAYSREPACYRH